MIRAEPSPYFISVCTHSMVDDVHDGFVSHPMILTTIGSIYVHLIPLMKLIGTVLVLSCSGINIIYLVSTTFCLRHIHSSRIIIIEVKIK